MPLERALVTIPFAQGRDGKTDPFQLEPGKLQYLHNGVFTTAKKIRKRYGTTAKPTSIFGGGSIAAGDTLRAFKDELLLGSSGSLYSWAPASTSWVRKGGRVSVDVSRLSLAHAEDDISLSASAQTSGVTCVVYTAGLSVLAVLIETGQTGSKTVVPVAVGTILAVQVNVLAGQFVVSYNSSGTIYYRTLSLAGVVGSAVSVVAPTGLNNFATVATAGKVFFAYGSGAGPDISVKSLDSGLTLSSATAFGTTNLGLCAIAMGVDTNNGNLMVLHSYFSGGPGTIKLSVMSTALAVVTAGVTVEANVNNGSEPLCVGTTAAGVLRAWYTVRATASASSARIVRTNTLTSYAAGTPTDLLRSVVLVSKQAIYGSADYLVVQASDGVNRGRFLANAVTSDVVARLAMGDGSTRIPVEAVDLLVSGSSMFCPLMVEATNPANYTLIPPRSLDLASFNFYTTPAITAELADTVVFAGGIPTIYDGASVVEQGFNMDPGVITATASAVGTLTTGTVGVAAIYEWIDNSGAIHRSAPAFSSAVTTGGLPGVTVVVPTLRVTNKMAARGILNVVLYRTIVNGTVYYRDQVTANTMTADSVTFVRNNESGLDAGTLLYTTGGVLDNQPAPPFSAMTIYRNRIVGINAEKPTQLWYSKQVIPGEPVEFSDFLTLNLDPVGGDATALAALDDKLIIFKPGVAYYITGSGPDNTGGQNDFSVPILINTNSGCVEPRSVITAADGVMYKSAKGIYILDRSLQDSYIGYGVEDYNAGSVLAVVQVPSTNEVRFTLSGGYTLVYDFLYKQWSDFTGLGAVDSTVWNGVVHTLKSTGVVAYETPGVFTDNGTAIMLSLTTGWLGKGDLQSFLRIYKMMVLGTWKSSHTLHVELGYDYRTDLVAANAYSIVATSDPAPAQFQYRINLSQQKAEALQVTIYDTGTSGESLDLSAISFEVGVKSGPMKLPAARAV
jgi:hypothetical protein